MSTDSLQLDILRLFFPEGILDHFELSGFEEKDKCLVIHLDERYIRP